MPVMYEYLMGYLQLLKIFCNFAVRFIQSRTYMIYRLTPPFTTKALVRNWNFLENWPGTHHRE